MSTFFRFLFLLLLFSAAVNAQPKKNDRAKMKLEGEVKTLTEIQYKAFSKSGKTEKQYKGSWIKYSFGENGFLTEKTEYDPIQGDTIVRQAYLYNTAGLLTSIQCYHRDTLPAFAHFFGYDSTGNQILDSIENFGAQEKGHNTRYVYSYDQKGNCVEMKGYNSKGNLFSRYDYSYDKNGNQFRETWLDQKGDTIHRYKRKFDSSGKITSEQYIPGSTGGYTTKYQYNSSGLLTSETAEFNGNLLSKSIYAYDSQHNWISETNYEKGKVNSVKERTIEYYTH